MQNEDWGHSATAHLPREFSAQNLRRWASAYLAHLLDQPEERIDLYRGLTDYGLDSMDAVVMAGELEEHFGIEIDPALFLREASLGALIGELERPSAS